MSSIQRLELRQGQSLVMTPQLLQSIKLLQLSHLELAAFVEAELERNPLLQEAEAGSAAPAASRALPKRHRAEGEIARIFPRSTARNVAAISGAALRPGGGHAELGSDLEATLARSTTLAEHLEAQLDLATADSRVRAIGLHLIHSLNEAGYLSEDVGDVAATLGLPAEEVEAALRLIQGFDPPGVGARTLAECLSIQLRERNRLDPAMQALIDRLDLVARHDFEGLKRICGVDGEDLTEMLAEIRRLEPRPGLAFAPARVDILIPDVLVKAAPDGGFEVELNQDTLPKVLLDRTYHARVAKAARSEEDRIFLSECLESAHWLTRSLDQRARTILKVATEIVRRQEDFFRDGVAALRPLTLRNVAEAVGLHESTISRVVSNKAVGSPRGVFPMKYFFGSAAGEGGLSSEAVRHRIRRLVDAEAQGRVLSDDAIAQKLREEGIDIARRTVAKYRTALRIPSSADRRRRAKSRAKAS